MNRSIVFGCHLKKFIIIDLIYFLLTIKLIKLKKIKIIKIIKFKNNNNNKQHTTIFGFRIDHDDDLIL